MTDKEKCIQCGHQCCKWCGFTSDTLSGRSVEFYLAKGCKILRADKYDWMHPDRDVGHLFRVYVPSKCPHLVEGEGCDIYEDRPLACVEYCGSLDPLLQDVCLIKDAD
jgi:Fe-S-cluster containining protein